METTVDFQTAKELRDAGFPQPEPALLQQLYLVEERSGKVDVPALSVLFTDGSPYFITKKGLVVWLSDAFKAVYAPTALEIIEQMPHGTHIKQNPDSLWYVWFELPGFQRDFRHDTCPHKSAAMAYLAWKKGQQ